MEMIDRITKNIRRISAPNAGPLTHKGTNTYILGDKAQIIIDPGPDIDSHFDEILKAAPNPSAILVTHSHLDHSELVPRLKAATGVDVYAFGSSKTGRSHRTDYGPAFTDGPGTDHNFEPDHILCDKARVVFRSVAVTAHWTPGHFSNHMCFASGGILFSGDIIMGWASTVISAPEGNIQDFANSCKRLRSLDSKIYLPGHGDPIMDGPARVEELLAHRRSRISEITNVLKAGPATPKQITQQIYTDITPDLMPAAQSNVMATLITLIENNMVVCQGQISTEEFFALKR